MVFFGWIFSPGRDTFRPQLTAVSEEIQVITPYTSRRKPPEVGCFSGMLLGAPRDSRTSGGVTGCPGKGIE